MTFAPDPTFREGLAFNVQQEYRNHGGPVTGAFHVGADVLAPLGNGFYLNMTSLQRVHTYAQVIGVHRPEDARRINQPPPHRMHSSAQSSSLRKAKH